MTKNLQLNTKWKMEENLKAVVAFDSFVITLDPGNSYTLVKNQLAFPRVWDRIYSHIVCNILLNSVTKFIAFLPCICC